MIAPLTFNPIFKQKIWGGAEICRFKGTAPQDAVGESFEVSTLPGDESVVAEGEFAGRTLADLVKTFGPRIVGNRVFERFGTEFPLLIKFIDAAEPLSVQVHPDDKLAQEMGHPYGKMEMWYIVESRPGASLLAGFSTDFSAERYAQSLADGTLQQYINVEPTRPGDTFVIPPGCIHSIGAGNLLIEIQQSSGDTFRVYDFDRVGADGKKRELHVAQAQRALCFKADGTKRVAYTPTDNAPVLLASTPYFTTRRCRFTHPATISYATLDSFVVFIAYEGTAILTDAAGNKLTLPAGHSALFPAENASVTIAPAPNAPFAFLEASLG